jgi:hypothetical protein
MWKILLIWAGLASMAAAWPAKAEQGDATKQAPLMTRWAADVSPSKVLPDYPRPQMVRAKWRNLNGLWEFSTAKEADATPVGKTLAEHILVPFPVESALSGLMRTEERMWYRRLFTVPADWAGQRVLLHFGAVDWKAEVYVNGADVGGHQGGYGAFTLDVTDHLKPGDNELIVNVFAPVDTGRQPVGKQSRVPRGYWYRASSGIWQTVWLEAVPSSFITRLDLTPDVANGKLRLIVQGMKADGQAVEAVASTKGVEVARATGVVGREMELPIANARLWSPDDPFLYALKVTLKKDAATGDEVTGYFGMRSIATGRVAGILRPLLNGKFVFEIGTLDQGFWPDGNYTAPTDEALRFDLEQEKKLGYNTVRKHIKVEPARWYYWADKLGILVYQDMPSMAPGGVMPAGTVRTDHPDADDAQKKEFEGEFREMIDQLRSTTAIVGWIEFNENWGEYRDKNEVRRLADWIKNDDPSRLLVAETGVGNADAGDAYDWHTYPGPGSPPPSGTRIAGQGEFGGMGFVVKDHSWTPVNKDNDTSAKFTARYVDMIGRVKALMDSPGLSYAFFTQITDVENERNGLFTYDRAVLKGELEAIQAAQADLIAASKRLSDSSISKGYYSNLSAEADVMPGARGEGGIRFRMDPTLPNTADDHGYFAGLSIAGVVLSYAHGGTWTPIKSATVKIEVGKTYHLKVEAFGGTIRVFVDDRNTPVLEATDYRSLTGSVTTSSTDEKTKVANLKVGDPFVRLMPPGNRGFIIHDSHDGPRKDIVRFHDNVNNTPDALWQIVPGLADPSGISFESAALPGFYLLDRDGTIVYAKDDGSPGFKPGATWNRKPGLADPAAFSYESPSHPGEYLQGHSPLVRKPASATHAAAEATFFELK